MKHVFFQMNGITVHLYFTLHLIFSSFCVSWKITIYDSHSLVYFLPTTDICVHVKSDVENSKCNTFNIFKKCDYVTQRT